MYRKSILFVSFFFILSFKAQIKVLFDATKSEMAGNADWVIDADSKSGGESNPQRIPTPAQSGITASTSETYWNGALSYWAIDLVRQGFTVETLPISGKITYGDSTNAQDLSNYKIFIVDEPNNQFTTTEKDAIVNFVKNGGGLFAISDHTNSDRDNDGWDSPAVWNDLFTTNTVKANPFGITFDLKSISPYSTNFATSTTNPTILAGKMGTPTDMMFSSGTTMTLNTTNNSTAKGLVFVNGSSTTGTTNVMFATATYGTGRVCALGDSSVPDDGSGDTGDTLYDGYITDANGNHQKILVNAVVWLANLTTLGTSDASKNLQNIEIYPNPAKDLIYFNSDAKVQQIEISDASGKIVVSKEISENKFDVEKLSSGIYYITLKSGSGPKTLKLIKK